MSIETDLPFDTGSVAEGRRLVAAALRAEGIAPSLGDDLTLAAAELLGNAVRHGRPRPDGTIGLSLTVTSETVEVAVADGGTGPAFAPGTAAPQPLRPGEEPAPGGYGLLIVRALGELGVERGPSGTRVTARLTRTPIPA